VAADQRHQDGPVPARPPRPPSRRRPAGVSRSAGDARLRREEPATLAGISSDCYVRLERGRETRPSPVVVDAHATALQLTEDEREHLRSLAALAARPTLRPLTPKGVGASHSAAVCSATSSCSPVSPQEMAPVLGRY
jgi:hypothetical protein